MKTACIKLIAIVAILLFAFCARTRAEDNQFIAPISTTAPKIDGIINDDEWKNALEIDGFAYNGRLERRKACAFLMADSKHIYVAIRSQLPSDGTLVSNVDRDVEKVIFDDCVEIWIDPAPGSDNGAVFQLIENVSGHYSYLKHNRGNEAADPNWRGDWITASKVHDGYWDFEACIPTAQFGANRISANAPWAINLCRDWKQPQAWSSMLGGGYKPETTIRFSETAPVIRQNLSSDPFTGNISNTVGITAADSAGLIHISQHLKRDKMPDIIVDSPAAEATVNHAEVPITIVDRVSSHFNLEQRVMDATDNALLFSRTIEWTEIPGDWKWTTQSYTKPPIDVQYAYYPYSERLRVALDISGLSRPESLSAIQISVRPKGLSSRVVKTILATQFDNRGRCVAEFALPGLNGDYELVVKATGSGVPGGDIVKPLPRHRFEWEHNALGLVDKAYAPFIPLKLTGHIVHATLRDYTLNGLGLIDQVTATSDETGVTKPILSGPMYFVVQSESGNEPVKESGLRIDTCNDTHVDVTGGFQAGPLQARIQSSYSLDGMALVKIKLEPTRRNTIKELTLNIPLRDDAAPYMHAMTDGIRDAIVTGYVPSGQGVVWDATRLSATDLPKGFCTYIYAGSPVRGLCWFSENDKGWSWDEKSANVDLVRTGKVLTMRIHLINAPIQLDEPRTIVFGFQAAPVKRRLAPWRERFWRDHYGVLATDVMWFALGDCASVYPAGKDMRLWDTIKRNAHEHLSESDLKAGYYRDHVLFEPYGDLTSFWDSKDPWINLRNYFDTKMIFYYNRASAQLFDEFQTFENEWALTDFRTVGPGSNREEIKIVPSPSYIDYALYWYGKSFDLGDNQGVYCDNQYLVGSYNTVMTAAYHRSNAMLVPSSGLMGLRDLTRRTFNYMNERKMLPITMAHTTSTSILPILSYDTVQLDWEWHYSEGDAQDRYSRPYILLVSNGELAGTWPVLLPDQGKLANDSWTQRTYAAVSIVHELVPERIPSNCGSLYDPIVSELDDPNLIVYRYWDERPQPVASGNPDLPTIVYSVPGHSAVSAVVSYLDHDGDVTLTIDPKALGFIGPYTVSDVETGAMLQIIGNRVNFSLKKHDIRELRIAPAPS